MLRKLLIVHLLFVLALLPVAQAVSPIVDPVETEQSSHMLTVMECGQENPNDCVDLESCVSGGHASCDSKSKSTLLPSASFEQPDNSIYIASPHNQYSSHHAELLLRPPRNA